MSRNSWSRADMPAFRDVAESTSCAGHPIRLSVFSLLQMGLLLAFVVTFVVCAVEPAPTDGVSPAWSVATEHAHGVEAVAFSPDGRRLATGGDDGCIVLCEVGKGIEKVLSSDRGGRVVSVAFSRDGTTLASGHRNRGVVLWDATNGQQRVTLKGHIDTVRRLDFSPDGATIATGSDDGSIAIWDVASGRGKATLCGHFCMISSVKFSPDGRTLASGCAGGLVKLWDVSSGKCRHSFDPNGHGYAADSLAFSRDGLMLASGSASENVRLWDVATGRELTAPRTKLFGFRQVTFSADGQLVIALKGNGELHVRDLSAKCERMVRLESSDMYCSAFSPDRSLLAQGDLHGTVRIWDLNTVVNGRLGPPALDQ